MTLGDALTRARVETHETREAHTVLVQDGDFSVLPSHEFAILRENNAAVGLTPVVSFLPNGGVESHRPAYDSLAEALRESFTFPSTRATDHV